MFTLAFWKAAAERAVKTFAQSLIAVGLTSATGILDVDWLGALSAAALAALLSLLSSVASANFGEAGPSVVGETLTENVAAEASKASPTGAVAGPAADAPEGTPVDVEPVTYGTKSEAAHHDGFL